MKIAVVVGALLAAAAVAAPPSERWLLVADVPAPSRSMIYADRQTLMRTSSGAKIWTETVFRKVTAEGVKMLREFSEVDCRTRSERVISRAAFDTHRGVIYASEKVMPWHPAPPDSVAESVVDAACQGLSSVDASAADPFEEADYLMRIEDAPMHRPSAQHPRARRLVQ